MADRTVDIRLNTSANTQGATQAENSIAGLKEEIRRLQVELEQAEIGSTQFLNATERLGQAQTRLNAAQGVVSAGLRKFGPQIQGTAYQLQDFVVQVGAGTSALQAMGQQAPQLLSLFGPGGAVAGLLVGIGAMAANAILNAKKAATDATEETRLATEGIQQLAKDAVDAIRAQDTAALDRISEANEAAQNLIKSYQDVATAQQATNIINADAHQKILEFEFKLAEALGVRVDNMQKIEAMRLAEQKSTEARAAKAIQEESTKVTLAWQDVEAKRKAADEAERAFRNVEAEIEARKKDRLQLQQQIGAMQSAAVPKFTETSTTVPGLSVPSTIRTEANQAERVAAQEWLQDNLDETRARTERIAAQIAELAKLIDPNEGETALKRKETREALIAATQAFNEQQAETKETITQIQSQIAADTSVRDINAIGEQQKALADEVKEVINSGIQPQTQAQADALATLKKMVSDNQIIATETAATTAALNALAPLLNGNFSSLNATSRKLVTDMEAMNRRLKELEAKTGQTINR